ncbi:MAG: response regulator [Anaerolineae bacterium]
MNDYPGVVYVEDDEMSRMVVDILLHEQMQLSNVVIFEDSQDFIARLDALSFIPDVILLDIHVKPLNGFQMISLLQRHPVYSDKPIVALTASVMNEEVALLKDAGLDGVFAKPLNEMTFPSMLERILAGEQIWNIF